VGPVTLAIGQTHSIKSQQKRQFLIRIKSSHRTKFADTSELVYWCYYYLILLAVLQIKWLLYSSYSTKYVSLYK